VQAHPVDGDRWLPSWPEAKDWGLKIRQGVDDDLLQISAGGYCSLHSHRTRHNLFRVVRGELYVGPFMGAKEPAKPVWVLLKPGCGFHVHPGIRHRFWSPGGCLARELSWGGPESDIERYTAGGISEEPPPLTV